MDDDRDEPAPGPAPLPVESNLRLVQRFLVGLALGLAMAQQSYLSSYRISGNSMTPAFLDGDRVVVAKSAGFLGEPHCGEAIIAEVDGEVVIKRVAGTPGDVVELSHGVLRRNGERVLDPIPSRYRDVCDFGPRTLGGDEYFLLGDHRRVSIDSREFGMVARAHILGRVMLRVPQSPAGAAAGAAARRR
jgi:signal peptidase I